MNTQSISVSFTNDNPTTALFQWQKECLEQMKRMGVRNPRLKSTHIEGITKDIILITGYGRHFNLCSHRKRRIAKKNTARALLGKLPKVKTSILKKAYPTDIQIDVEGIFDPAVQNIVFKWDTGTGKTGA